METEIVSNGFILDLSNAKKASQIIYELSSLLDMPEVRGKNICLKLGEINLNQSQLLSIKSLINSMNAELAFIVSASIITQNSSESLGIRSSSPKEETAEAAEAISEPESVKEEPIVSEPKVSVQTSQPESMQMNFQISGEFEPVKNSGMQISFENFEGETPEVKAEEAAQTAEPITKSEEVQTSTPLSFDLSAGIQNSEISAQALNRIVPPEVGFKFDELALQNGLLEPEDSYIQMDISKEELEARMGVDETKEVDSLATTYVQQTIRSGQTINADGNVLIIGDAHPGSEIVAKGDITVWGILGGIAHAGSCGNVHAKIRALKINAIQLRIANLYARRPDSLNIPFIQKTSEFTPQEAKVINGKIVLYKSNEIKE